MYGNELRNYWHSPIIEQTVNVSGTSHQWTRTDPLLRRATWMKSLQVENQLLMSVSMTSEIGTHKYCLPCSIPEDWVMSAGTRSEVTRPQVTRLRLHPGIILFSHTSNTHPSMWLVLMDTTIINSIKTYLFHKSSTSNSRPKQCFNERSHQAQRT